tara:strand:- start:190 stop:495 length:306 start_codon:yes stop_codon:yes gene_type:complete
MKNILTVAMMALLFVFVGVGCGDEKCDNTVVEAADTSVATDPGSVEEAPDVPVEDDVALPEEGTEADTSDNAVQDDAAAGVEGEDDSQASETTEVDEDASN